MTAVDANLTAHAGQLDEFRSVLTSYGARVVEELSVGPLRAALKRATGEAGRGEAPTTRLVFTLGEGRRGHVVVSTIDGPYLPLVTSSFGAGRESLRSSLDRLTYGTSLDWFELDDATNEEVARLYALVTEHSAGALAALTERAVEGSGTWAAAKWAHTPEVLSRTRALLATRLIEDVASGTPVEWALRRAERGGGDR